MTSASASVPSRSADNRSVIYIIGTIAALAGLLFGMVQTLTIAYLPSRLTDTIIFSILFLILLVRPHGLFGRPEAGSLRGSR